MNATPPSEFAKIGLRGEFAKKNTAGTEWAGACPKCGGKDRFIVFTDKEFPHWRYLCRHCSPTGGWIDELYPRLKEEYKRMTPEERTQRATQEAREAEQRLALEIQRAQSALAELRQAQSWLRYHEQMNDWARQKWESWGVPDWFQDYWQLGYDPDRVIFSGGFEHHTATMTIPIFAPITWDVLNVRHRLLTPPKPNDKYRPEHSHLPPALFIAEPDLALKNLTVVVEGEKKAMVTFITYDDPNCQVVGIPGKTPGEKIFEQLKDCDPIYICLDSDAAKEAGVMAHTLGIGRCRLLDLPDKIDDLIIAGALDKDKLRRLLKTARRI